MILWPIISFNVSAHFLIVLNKNKRLSRSIEQGALWYKGRSSTTALCGCSCCKYAGFLFVTLLMHNGPLPAWIRSWANNVDRVYPFVAITPRSSRPGFYCVVIVIVASRSSLAAACLQVIQGRLSWWLTMTCVRHVCFSGEVHHHFLRITWNFFDNIPYPKGGAPAKFQIF
jgi:hypothetical protein